MSAAQASEWRNVAISDIALFGSGDLISIARLSARSETHPIPVYGGNGIAGYTSSAMVDQPTVIIGRVGQKCGVIYRNDGPVWVTDNALYARRFKRPLDVRFLALALEAARLNDLKNQNDLPLITQSILKDVQVAWPESVEEQRKIVEVMTDVDDLIASLERMIAKKQAIKQGVMQQLLTARSGKGDLVPLGSVTSWLSGGTPDRSNHDYWNGSIPWISAASLKSVRIYDSDQHITAEAVRSGSRMAPIGATLMLVRGMALHREVRAGLALSPVSFNQDVKAIVPGRSIFPAYLTYALHAKRAEILELVSSAGSGTGVLDIGLLKRLLIWRPSIDEQKKVVQEVDDFNLVIETLGRRLVKTMDLKRGMMQQLVAGRTRLSFKEAAV